MADMSKISVNGTEYDIKDQTARKGVATLTQEIELLPLPRNAFINTEVNLDTLVTPGFYAIDASCVVTGKPSAVALPVHYVKVEAIYTKNPAWIKQTIGRWERGNEFTRLIVGGEVKIWQPVEREIQSTNDTTNRTVELNTVLQTEKILKLGAGDFYIDGLVMPEGTSIEGCGANTRIITTNAKHALITVSNHCSIKNVALIGLQTAQPEQGMNSAHINRVGIYHEGYEENILISGCLIQGFGDYGIRFVTGGLGVNSVIIDNCTVKYCGVGIGFYNTEYACVSNCTIIDNFIGVKSGGGNNKFANCGIDSNGFGFYIAGDEEGVENHGHSSCVGCSFNHNVNRAIFIADNPHGFVFSGCCIFDASIAMSGTTAGTLFVGCEFGSGIEFRHLSTGSNYVMNCIFNKYGDITHTVGVGSARAQFINCYNFGTGAAVE